MDAGWGAGLLQGLGSNLSGWQGTMDLLPWVCAPWEEGWTPRHTGVRSQIPTSDVVDLGSLPPTLPPFFNFVPNQGGVLGAEDKTNKRQNSDMVLASLK